MKKAILLVTLIALLLSVNFALAKEKPEGTPFDAIWDAIDKIKTKIENIQKNSKTLTVVDAQNNVVGQFMGDENSLFAKPAGANPPSFNVYNDKLKLFYKIYAFSGKYDFEAIWRGDTNFYFETPNCQGDAYYDGHTPITPYTLAMDSSGNFFRAENWSDINMTINVQSMATGGARNDCVNDYYVSGQYSKMTPITMPVFVGPLSIERR
jgi:hypothetical protein